jgi:adenylate kinase family enzyme
MLHNDEFVIRYLIKTLREGDNNKVIIDDFPIKKEYFNIFAKNGKKLNKLIYMDCSDFTCIKRMKMISSESEEYLGTAKLNKLIQEYDKKIDLLNIIKESNNFIEIDANKDFCYVQDDVLTQIQPQIYMFSSTEKSKGLLTNLVDCFVNDYEFQKIDVNTGFYLGNKFH